MSFSAEELRRGIEALAVVENRGDRHEWVYILREAQDSAPNGSRWGNATTNQQISGQLLAGQLAKLLGEPLDKCEEAAADVFVLQRRWAVYDALISYADELTGQSSRCESATTSTPIRRPAVRIVADQEGAA